MQLTPHVDALLADLSSLAALGDESTAQAAERLGQALRSSAGLRLLDLLAEAALEVSDQLPAGQVEVRLAGQEPSLVYVEDEPEVAAAPAEEGMDARISLRLPETLKAAAEAAAAREGLSVNAWIVRSLKRSLDTPARRTGRRLTGFAES
jgi:predicted HicB family RNase H-like nuclease